MLRLDDPHWSTLQHAYGPAGDIPPLLAQLGDLPAADGNREPWFSLWSALAHQGHIYSASFAAVPHVVQALASDPLRADATYFQFPAWIEICRGRLNAEVPNELSAAYHAALSRLPTLVASAMPRAWSEDFLACALAAIAVAKGPPAVAEAIMELSADVADEFIEWHRTR